MKKLLLILFLKAIVLLCGIKKVTTEISEKQIQSLHFGNDEELIKYVNMGTDAVEQIKRLETNLRNRGITVADGTVSHSFFIDSLPYNETIVEEEVALKILEAAQFFYNSKCASREISGEECQEFLSSKSIPRSTRLYEECKKSLQLENHRFKRILPANYKDGFYEMWHDLPSPRLVSQKFRMRKSYVDENLNNLLLVLWAQFVEHDLSKPVLTTKLDGSSIECCNRNNFKHLPRFTHPACAPIIERVQSGRYSKDVCFNYVRSGLAVPVQCNFEYANQLNKATGTFDLSQLYGHSDYKKKKVRLFSNGLLKASRSLEPHQSLLPQVDENSNTYCSFKRKSDSHKCYMAGDSRVNQSPFTILSYTLFLRNHNQIALELKNQSPYKTDEELFQEAKIINIDIYNRIIFDEWLPTILGEYLSSEIKKKGSSLNLKGDVEVFNEVAVASLRFYISMLPNNLKNPYHLNRLELKNGAAKDYIFDYKEQMYKPSLNYSSSKLNDILESVLEQNAMKFDHFYEENFVPENFTSARLVNADILAYDIQRGRDHGLQSYAKYLEMATRKKISSWNDLQDYISPKNLEILQEAYSDWNQIDLIIGGVSEKPKGGSLLGETFSYLLGEQLSLIYSWYVAFQETNAINLNKNPFKMKALDVICNNSDLKQVPRNAFKLASAENPLISCNEHILLFRQ